jgi:electron transport complex protein RnfC
MAPAERVPYHTIVIMAIEREPGLAVQRRILTERRSELAESIEALRRLAGTARIVLVIPESSAADLAESFPGIEIRPVSNRYPANHWRLVLAQIAGKGNISIPAAREEGILFITAETIAYAGGALKKGLPRMEKLVTVTGKGLEKPVTVSVRLGTPIQHVLGELAIEVAEGDRVLLGGYWQGHAQCDLEAPITLGTDGLTVIPGAQVTQLQEEPCINCGRCVTACPVRIQVNIVGRLAEFGFAEEAYAAGASACIECGLCAYVCPAQRPLLQYMRFGISGNQQALVEVERQPEGAPAQDGGEGR